MNTLCFLLVAPALLAGADAAAKKTDKEQLQGTWRVTATEFDGQALSADTLKDRQIVFTEDRFKVVVGGREPRGTRTFTLDSGKTPKQIDIGNPDKLETAHGIYVLEKDELKFCYAEPGDKRPTEFSSPAGKRIFLLTLKRGDPGK